MHIQKRDICGQLSAKTNKQLNVIGWKKNPCRAYLLWTTSWAWTVPLMCRWVKSKTSSRWTKSPRSLQSLCTHTHLSAHAHTFLHTHTPFCAHTHTHTQPSPHLVSSTDQRSRLTPIPRLLTFYTVFVFTLSLRPLPPLALIPRHTQDLCLK